MGIEKEQEAAQGSYRLAIKHLNEVADERDRARTQCERWVAELEQAQAENERLKSAMRPLLREVKELHSMCPEAGCTRLGWVQEAEAALAEGGSDADPG